MLCNEKTIDTDLYYKELKTKLKNLFNSAPIVLDIQYSPFFISIEYKERYIFKTYNIDYNRDIKDFIKEIKTYLIENLYPVMTEIKTNIENYTEKEISDLLEKNSNLCVEDLILEKKKTKKEISYRIEKTNIKENEIVLRNLDNNKVYLYKLNNIPCVIFLKNVVEKWSKEYSFQVFKSKSKMIKCLSD